jgi:integrase
VTVQKRVKSDGKATYRAIVRVKGAPTRTASFSTLAEARKWRDREATRLRTEKHFPEEVASNKTVADAIQEWRSRVAPKLKDGAKPSKLLDFWHEEIGHVVLRELRPSRIGQLRDQLAGDTTRRGRTRTGATVNRYLAALSSVLGCAAKEWGWIDSNPCTRVKRETEGQGRERFLSGDEQQELLAAAQQSEDARIYPLVLFALTTGARQGELMALQWGDVDVDSGVCILRDTKNGTDRRIYLSGRALDVLREMKRYRVARVGKGRAYVFADPNGEPRFPAKRWLKARDAAGLEPSFRFHDLRHTAASNLAQSGATLIEIATILGHKTLAMVRRYSHLSEGHVRDVVARAAEKFVDGR